MTEKQEVFSSAKKSVPSLNISLGATSCTLRVPQLAFGTWLMKDPGECRAAVRQALELGYRHIDCAYVYGNQREVGAALTQAIADGVVKRQELFVVSKVWNTFHSRDRAIANVEQCLEQLGVDYLDLMFIHWPMSYAVVVDEGGQEQLFPKGPDGHIITDDIDYMETWGAMEECVRAGKIRAIGLSNFNAEQVQRVIDEGTIRPVALQVEMNPFFQQKSLADFCRLKGLALEAYSPLLNPRSPFYRPEHPSVFTHPVITEIACAKGMTNAQLALRFLAQCYGAVVLTKSVRAERMLENMAAFTDPRFELSASELERLQALDLGEQGGRLVRPMGANPATAKFYPFTSPPTTEK